jgi:hypothetical protein
VTATRPTGKRGGIATKSGTERNPFGGELGAGLWWPLQMYAL